MKLSKSARYALHAALEMTLAGEAPVTVVSVAAKFGIPPTALAKVFQKLVRAGIARGTRGAGGGYRLAKGASARSVLDVIAPFEPQAAPGQCLLDERDGASCPRREECGVRRLLDEADDLMRSTFASVSLATLARRSAPRPGHR